MDETTANLVSIFGGIGGALLLLFIWECIDRNQTPKPIQPYILA
jgi:hypothetical protein